jgi:hypothetical protein
MARRMAAVPVGAHGATEHGNEDSTVPTVMNRNSIANSPRCMIYTTDPANFVAKQRETFRNRIDSPFHAFLSSSLFDEDVNTNMNSFRIAWRKHIRMNNF